MGKIARRIARMPINKEILREVLGLPEGTIIHDVQIIENGTIEMLLSYEAFPFVHEDKIPPVVDAIFTDIVITEGYKRQFKHWQLKT